MTKDSEVCKFCFERKQLKLKRELSKPVSGCAMTSSRAAYLRDAKAGKSKAGHDVTPEGLEGVAPPPLQHREHTLQRREDPRATRRPAATGASCSPAAGRRPWPEHLADHADELLAQARRAGAVQHKLRRVRPPLAGYLEDGHGGGRLDRCRCLHS